jgi:hypothetical protein
MSNMAYIRTTVHDELSTKVAAPARHEHARSEIGRSVVTIVASVVIMAGLMAFRVWWLMPASIHLHN